MAINYPALRVELQTDPAALGYAPLLAAGAQNQVAAVLTFLRDGTTPCPVNAVVGAAISVNRGTITTQELVEAVVQSDMPASANQRDWLLMVCAGDHVRVDTGSTARTGLLAIFGPATATRANLTAVSSRTGSRAEELFGAGTAVSDADIAAALAS